MAKSKLEEMLTEHIKAEEGRLQALHASLDNLKDNHIHHLSLDISDLKADMRWVKWAILTVLGATFASIIGSVLELIKK